MPDERELRDLFAATAAPTAIDADRVIARARRRRRPKQLAAGAVGSLAVVGVLMIGVQTFQPAQPTATLMQEDTGGAAAPEAADAELKRAPADKLNLCEGVVAEPMPSASGLQLDIEFPPTAAAGGEPVPGAVLLTNAGSARVTGETATAPAITVSQGGVVLWHTNGPTDTMAFAVDLEPGESVRYEASFTPVRCGVEDDARESFRAELPPLAPGAYELSAALDFMPDPSMGAAPADLDLVTGPREPIMLQQPQG